eukprot:TRINITY_DN28514_c0_g1_i2.p1 TRINITY_DN28514_c0_g1~~TRINITY_DN28514_c0_g1_i2.p1  ORF type:complete len:657 (-),score=148.54 TRINITY_DN28514_c0_g1_i2:25-1995(-)
MPPKAKQNSRSPSPKAKAKAGESRPSSSAASRRPASSAAARSSVKEQATVQAPENAVKDEAIGHEYRSLSVKHISTTFLEKIEAVGKPRSSKVFEVEECVIRKEGADLVCPRDKRKGSAYVDAVTGLEHASIATAMLSYSWGSGCDDIAGTLLQHCENLGWKPADSYIWMCCTCINQHRVQERLKAGEQVPFNEFRAAFGDRVKGIGHVVCMMSPWRQPRYIQRVWCVFELYTATELDVTTSIAMPTEEANDFLSCLCAGGVHEMWRHLGAINVEAADASFPEDKDRILQIVKDGPGFHKLNCVVAKQLQAWVVGVSENFLKSELASAELEKPLLLDLHTKVADLCAMVGESARSRTHFEDGEKFVSEHALEKSSAYMLFLRSKAKLWRQLGETDRSVEIFSKAEELRKELNYEEDEASLTQAGLLATKQGKHQDALAKYLAARSIIEGREGMRSTAGCSLLMNMAIVHQALENRQAALEMCLQARKILEDIGELMTPLGAQITNNLANLYRQRDKIPEAVEMYRVARRVSQKLGQTETPSYVHLIVNTAILCGQSGDLTEAQALAEESLELMHKLQLKDDRVEALANQIVDMAKAEQEGKRQLSAMKAKDSSGAAPPAAPAQADADEGRPCTSVDDNSGCPRHIDTVFDVRKLCE